MGHLLAHSPMIRLFTIVVALLTLVHSVFGCCAHHAHAVHMTACSHGEASEHGHTGDRALVSQHCHAASSRHNCPDDKCPENCGEGSCNFARTEVSGDSVSFEFGLTPQLCLVEPVSDTALEYLRSLVRNELHTTAGPLSHASLRGHLALSILLV